MDASIVGILMLDGATNGAVYALLALAIVLVFAVTRVIFIPQGEFVAYGALTLALLQLGRVPGTVWLLVVLALLAAVLDAVQRARRGVPLAQVIVAALKSLAIPR
jgi:branched-chain amino acid transport system permease protein